ncbi:MAG: universal stress protein [Planctomycetota bacterium]
MLRSLLIGLDGSPYSAAAIELCVAWAREFEAALAGIAIIDDVTFAARGAAPLGGEAFKRHRDAVLLQEARQKIGQHLSEFTARAQQAQVAARIIDDIGVPAARIMEEAQAHDLIVLGQRTFYHLRHPDHDDETLHHVLKNAPRPVVAVPQKIAPGSTVLVAYDGSLQAARTLQAFEALGLHRARDLYVVSVDQDGEAAERVASRAKQFLAAHGVMAMPCPTQTKEAPADVILAQAKALEAQVIVMGAYGKPALREFLVGSVTRQLLQKSPVPLFLFH